MDNNRLFQNDKHNGKYHNSVFYPISEEIKELFRKSEDHGWGVREFEFEMYRLVFLLPISIDPSKGPFFETCYDVTRKWIRYAIENNIFIDDMQLALTYAIQEGSVYMITRSRRQNAGKL